MAINDASRPIQRSNKHGYHSVLIIEVVIMNGADRKEWEWGERKRTEKIVDGERRNVNSGPVLLWIDLTELEHDPVLPCGAEEHCCIHLIRDIEHIGNMVESIAPNLLCFEYDYPTDIGLTALTQTKREYPKLPILMLTVYHSEALAVWALRTRVWDYLVKPFSATDLLRSAISLFSVCRENDRRAARKIISPIPDTVPLDTPNTHQKAVLKAQSYIVKNLHEVIRLRDVAAHCGMSATHFSRVFTQTSATNFNEFVRRTRVRKAVEMLADPGTTMKAICYGVGFNDESYFSRTFRRYVGMTPSMYQKTIFDNAHGLSHVQTQLKRNSPDLQ